MPPLHHVGRAGLLLGGGANAPLHHVGRAGLLLGGGANAPLHHVGRAGLLLGGGANAPLHHVGRAGLLLGGGTNAPPPLTESLMTLLTDLMPSGMMMFLCRSPSIPAMRGNSELKLLTVKRRFTNELSSRWSKSLSILPP